MVGRIWPDKPQAKSRRLLSDALYALRKALGEDAIVSLGDEEIRLNRTIVWTDVGAFEAALDEGALEKAVGHYGGEFLAGFHLSGSVEFDRWVEGERRRLRDRYTAALEQLAAEAQSAGDANRAIAFWKRRALEDPLNSRVTRSLMSAFMSAGNPAAALDHAQRHEAALQHELGLELPPEINELVVEIKAASTGRPAVSAGAPPDGETASDDVRRPVPPGDAGQAPLPPAAKDTAPEAADGWAVRWPPRMSSLLLVLMVGLVWGAAMVAARDDDPGNGPVGLAVLPVQGASAESSSDLFTTGLRLELIHGLWALDGVRVVDWGSSLSSRESRPTGAEVARELGASYVLDPVLVPGEGAGALVVQLVEARTGEVRWSGRYESSLGPGSLTTMPEQVAQGVADVLSLGHGRPARTAPTPPTENLAAYDAYIRGKALQWRGRVDEWYRAEALFERATELDPDFGEAWAALGEIRSFMLFFHIMDRSVGSARSALERASALAPDAVATHRAHAILHNNTLDYDASREHLERIGELEPGNPDVPYLLAMIAMWQGRWEESIRLHTVAAELNPQATRASFGAGLAYLRLGRYEEADLAFDRAREIDPGMPWVATWRIFVPLKRDSDLEEARHRLAQAVDDAGAWPVLYEISKPKAAEVRPFTRILIDDLAVLLAVDSTRAALRRWCRPCDLRLQALSAGRRGDATAAFAYHDSLRAHFDSLAARSDELAVVGPQMWSWLGLELARIGRGREALDAASRATDAVPWSRDAFKATYLMEALAAVHTMTGNHAAAVEQLGRLLSVPSELTPAVLRLDPMWDPLRSRPDFQELMDIAPATPDRDRGRIGERPR